METGIPHLDLPPLDPMSIDRIGFTFWNLTAEFLDTKLRGFKGFRMKYSRVDKQKRSIEMLTTLSNMSTTSEPGVLDSPCHA